MRIRKAALMLAAGATIVAGCNSLDVTNPNQQTGATFWKTEADANAGLVATYNALAFLGVYSRWGQFANDLRSDIGTAEGSPWGDLANYVRFVLNDYNFDVNRDIWANEYEMIGRANLVIANVPNISMDATERDQIVAQAKFLRALAYYNLVVLWENVPLVLTPPDPSERPAAAPPADTWAQIEKDLTEAAAALPESWPAGNSGRPTKYSALGMLGKAQLQQRKWAQAATTLQQVIASGKYSLLANYADNFKESSDNNNPESLFEVENEDMFPIGVTGMSFPKMIGPCYRPGGGAAEFSPTFCDGRPTRWYFNVFKTSKTKTGGLDPRLDATLLYNTTDTTLNKELIYGAPRPSYFVDVPGSAVLADTMIFFRKYGETYGGPDQRWDNPINYKVLRYADVLLMEAEAQNEAGQTANAFSYVNKVRERVDKSDLAGLSQAQLRDTLLFERMFELGLEQSRWQDMLRHPETFGTWAGLTPAQRDNDFKNFDINKSIRLPIPTTERNLNPNIQQNPGW